MDQDNLTSLRGFIRALLLDHDDASPFEDTESLIRAGRLDSLSVVKLVTFLESEFGVDFTRIEFDPERFDSVEKTAAMVDESRKSA